MNNENALCVLAPEDINRVTGYKDEKSREWSYSFTVELRDTESVGSELRVSIRTEEETWLWLSAFYRVLQIESNFFN